MGNLFDVATFDLANAQGQANAIKQLFENHNDVYGRSESLTSYQVVAYAQLTVDLVNGDPTGIYTATYKHGLGYPPLVLPFGLQPSGGGNNQYTNVQYQEISFNTGVEFTYQYYSIDDQNVVYRVHARNVAGLFTTTHFTAAFYIFNLPLNNI